MEGDSMSSPWAGPAAFFAQAGFPFPGLSNGFPGFPFGFPAHGFTGSDQSSERKMSIKPPHFMDSTFMSGGNIDFMKMATLVRFGKRTLHKLQNINFFLIHKRILFIICL